MSDATPQPNRSILSDFADDPDMLELVEEFVESMPERIESLRGAFETGAAEDLKRLAHQLKGASGGYGFGPLGEVAGRLEHELGALEENGLQSVRASLEELISFCSRVAVR